MGNCENQFRITFMNPTTKQTHLGKLIDISLRKLIFILNATKKCIGSKLRK